MVNELGIWEVAVLALLRQAPIHPYQMKRLLHERHKDEILVLKPGSLYHAIGRLVRAALISVSATSRAGRRPERTTYRITPKGRKEFIRVLRQIVSVPRRESSDFMAALSFLVHLAPAESLSRLEERCRRLEAEIAALDTVLTAASKFVARINLIESEYLVAMLRAELAWVRKLIAEIRAGKLDWNIQKILKAIRATTKAARRAKE